MGHVLLVSNFTQFGVSFLFSKPTQLTQMLSSRCIKGALSTSRRSFSTINSNNAQNKSAKIGFDLKSLKAQFSGNSKTALGFANVMGIANTINTSNTSSGAGSTAAVSGDPPLLSWCEFFLRDPFTQRCYLLVVLHYYSAGKN
jgi:hypothetical protein